MRQDYRLLVLDLDGTLTNSKKEISPRNLRTLLHLQQSGVRLVLASGRPTYGIAPLAEQLKMKDTLQWSARGDKMQEAIGSMDNAVSSIEKARQSLGAAAR